MDRFWGFGFIYYDQNPRKFSVPLYYVLEKIIHLRLEELENMKLRQTKTSRNISHYVLGFRIHTHILVISGLNPPFGTI
jgi:hypothetical protein